MDLSPNDIRNFEFHSQMRGYAKDEVDNFREQVAATLETVKQENLKLLVEIDSLKTQLAGLRQFEDTIKSAAIDARRNADLTVANAKKEAELILTKAKTEAVQAVGARAQKMSAIEEQITKLQFAKRSYLSKLRNLIKSHLEVLEEVVSGETAPKPKSDLEVTESTEVLRKKLETIATKPEMTGPIKAEEANAPEQIVPVPTPPVTGKAEPSPTDQAALSDRPVDPELAAALEKYQRKEAPPAEQPPAPTPTAKKAPAPGEIVETSARAEDIPEGFIVPKTDTPAKKDSTDKVSTDSDTQPKTTENKPPVLDVSCDPAESDTDVNPENLAKELDRVVAKFEEEMDKAEKN